jgi:multidrug efflux pump subunit AcrA (membrane-fusion protein)
MRAFTLWMVVLAAPGVAFAQPAAAPVTVTRVKVARRDVRGDIGLAATIAPRQWTELTAPAAGWVTALRADLGDVVKRGQALADVRPESGATRPLVAPFDGVVVARSVHLGAHVTPSGAPLYTVVDDAQLRVLASVPEVDVAMLRVGEDATVTAAAYPGAAWKGKLARLARELSATTHTLPIEIEIDNADRRLMGGMSAYVHLEVAAHKQALVVPRAAIAQRDGATFAFRADAGRAHRVPVAVGFDEGNDVEILSGLSDGDEVLLSDRALTEGAPVSVR